MKSNSTEGYEKLSAIAGGGAAGLEHSCMAEGIREAPSRDGIARIEARFRGIGFSPHRHDTYAIGVTLSGVQRFRYRGAERSSQVGNVIVLHPDELHDGSAGTEDGLRYRMLYLPPEKLIAAGSGASRALPFVPGAVVEDPRFRTVLAEALADLSATPGELWLDGLLAEVSDGLWRHADASLPGAVETAALEAVSRCCDYLRAHCERDISSLELEAVSGLDRFTIARQFRRLVGTSPHRYLVMRRLERARALINRGLGLAQAAAEAGFADQAHLTRHFKKSYGMTPGRWAALSRG